MTAAEAMDERIVAELARGPAKATGVAVALAAPYLRVRARLLLLEAQERVRREGRTRGTVWMVVARVP